MGFIDRIKNSIINIVQKSNQKINTREFPINFSTRANSNEKTFDIEFTERQRNDNIKNLSYYRTIEKQIKPLENTMVQYATKLSNTTKIDDRIKLLKFIISTFYELKDKCISLGNEFEKYFSENWEHCHNSQNADFNYVERFESELSDIAANYNSLIELEMRYERESQGLEDKVISVLKENSPILQTDVYNMFDACVKNDIKELLYYMDKNGVIERIKSGRTYEIRYL